MITVKFYGNLKQFGMEFKLDVRDTAEAIRALCTQIKGLRQALQQGYYKVRIGKDYLNPEALEQGLFYRLKKGKTIHFTPVISGAKRGGIFNVVLGAVMIAAAFVSGGAALAALGFSSSAISMVGVMGIALALSGVAQMLTKTPTMDTSKREEQEKKSSTAFSNLNNIVAQGKPVPLAYGLIRTGSLIISQGLETMTITTNKPADTKKPAIKTRLRSKMRGQQ